MHIFSHTRVHQSRNSWWVLTHGKVISKFKRICFWEKTNQHLPWGWWGQHRDLQVQSHLLFSYLSPPPEFETTTNKNFAQHSLWDFFSKNGAVLRKRLMRRALWGSETIPKPTAAAPARPQHPSPAQLLLQPSTRLASLTGTAASWHVLQEPSLRGREKKKKNYYKCSTNYESRGWAFVPALLDFALSLVFPRLRREPRWRRDWPRLCWAPWGHSSLSPGQGTTWV